MPRYFFDTDTGHKLFRDEEGSELPDDQEARDLAALSIGEMARDYLPGDEPQKNITMWVRNENCEPVMELTMRFAVKSIQPTGGSGLSSTKSHPNTR